MQNPCPLLEIFEKVDTGLYVAVGTERGFIGAAIAKASSLLLVDHDPEVRRFNKINIYLLKIADDRTHYLRLRLELTIDEWKKPDEDYPSIDEDFLWWKKRVRQNDEFKDFHEGKFGFGMTSYLRHDDFFNHLSNLAKSDNIESVCAKLTNTSSIRQLVSLMHPKNYKISVIDISNVWWKVYMGSSHIAMLREFEKIATNETKLVLTGDYSGGMFFEYGHHQLQEYISSHKTSIGCSIL